ncbi:MAG: substrate-binding periplasmic protein [Oleiphilus sp.]|mgnify:CR=1 FL=1
MVQITKTLSSLFIIYLLTFISISSAQPREKILVGVAHFPPFIVNENGKVGGLAMDMIKLMNAQQSKYEFIALPTLSNTRHKIFDLGRYDMSMFDSLDWGWEGREVDASDIYLEGGEVYITQAIPGRTQAYFDDFKGKSLVGIEGYHYAFANFNSDPDFLSTRFNMKLTRSNLGSIEMILAGNRGDIAVVTKSYLGLYLNNHPAAKDKLLISSHFDQRYQHRIILRRGISLTITEVNALLSALKNSGKLAPLWAKINIQKND